MKQLSAFEQSNINAMVGRDDRNLMAGSWFKLVDLIQEQAVASKLTLHSSLS